MSYEVEGSDIFCLSPDPGHKSISADPACDQQGTQWHDFMAHRQSTHHLQIHCPLLTSLQGVEHWFHYTIMAASGRHPVMNIFQ
jgi:hypothetical protein